MEVKINLTKEALEQILKDIDSDYDSRGPLEDAIENTLINLYNKARKEMREEIIVHLGGKPDV